jgi:hypothetical protein
MGNIVLHGKINFNSINNIKTIFLGKKKGFKIPCFGKKKSLRIWIRIDCSKTSFVLDLI